MRQADRQRLACATRQQVDGLVRQADRQFHLLAAGDLPAQPEVDRNHDLSWIGLRQQVQAQCASLHVDVAGEAVEGCAQIGSILRRQRDRPEDARDVCQEAWAKAYQNIGSLRDGAKFRAWIHYIALNLCRDRFRTLKSRAVHASYEEGGLEAFDHGAGKAGQWAATRQVEQTGLRRMLDGILSELPAEQRTAIVLREYQGFTSEEIAEITHCNLGTVKSRLNRARSSFAEIIEPALR